MRWTSGSYSLKFDRMELGIFYLSRICWASSLMTVLKSDCSTTKPLSSFEGWSLSPTSDFDSIFLSEFLTSGYAGAGPSSSILSSSILPSSYPGASTWALPVTANLLVDSFYLADFLLLLFWVVLIDVVATAVAIGFWVSFSSSICGYSFIESSSFGALG